MRASNVSTQLANLPAVPAGTCGSSLRSSASEVGISAARLEQLVAAGEVRAYRKGVGRKVIHLAIPEAELRELRIRLICESDDAGYRMRQLPKVLEDLRSLAALADSDFAD